jgi:hypothetical protein
VFLVTSNKARQLLYSSYIRRVRADEVRAGREETRALIHELRPGFCSLVDLTQFESLDEGALPELTKIMDLLAESGVGTVVRVIPDPSKDIGLKILSMFHYPRDLKVFTCESMTEAAKYLQP